MGEPESIDREYGEWIPLEFILAKAGTGMTAESMFQV